MNDALRGASSTKERREIKEKFKIDTNKAGNYTDNQMSDKESSNDRGEDNFKPVYNEDSLGGSGDGLPAFPNEPSDNVKAVLVWDGDNDEGRWLEGDPDIYEEDVPKRAVLQYNPDPTEDRFELGTYEVFPVVMCKDGAPINGNILFQGSD